MLFFFSYEEVRALDEERRRRSLALRDLSLGRPLEARRSPDPVGRVEAEVIELAFGAQCESSEKLGA